MRWRQDNMQQRRTWHAYGGGNGKVYLKDKENGNANMTNNKDYRVVYIEGYDQQTEPIQYRISIRDLEQTASRTRLPQYATPLDVEAEEDTTTRIINTTYDKKLINQFKPRRPNRTRQRIRRRQQVNQDFVEEPVASRVSN
jgi:hypothetical protein